MKQVLIAIDQLANTLCFWLPGGAWADESLSARAWRIQVNCPNLYRVIDGIFFFQKDHCYTSYISEILRLQSPPEERTSTPTA
jgi:hypothetical protein